MIIVVFLLFNKYHSFIYKIYLLYKDYYELTIPSMQQVYLMIPYYYREKSRINVVGDEKDMNLKNVKNIDGTIKEILSIKYHYEIDEVVSSRDLEGLLNYYLTLVKKTKDKDIFKKNVHRLMDVLDFFSNAEKKGGLEEESEEIAMDLITKVFDGKLEIPVSLNRIVRYSFSAGLTKEEVNYEIKWLILTLAILVCLK